MNLVELVMLTKDAKRVIEYLGTQGQFALRADNDEKSDEKSTSPEKSTLDSLQKARTFLGVSDITDEVLTDSAATADDEEAAKALLGEVDKMSGDYIAQAAVLNKTRDARDEALSFSNLKVNYDQLENLSFLSIRIGKVATEDIEPLKAALPPDALLIALGQTTARFMAVTSKKGRPALDEQLQKYDFTDIALPKDFKGIPAEVLSELESQVTLEEEKLATLDKARQAYADSHEVEIQSLIKRYTVSVRISAIMASLKTTAMTVRLTGWVPSAEVEGLEAALAALTSKRLVFRVYSPWEVPSVVNGSEKVPVKLKHGKFVSSFERMIFSYGSPLYGSVDPAPFVAVFFTILFGIMFGDAGQGLVFLLAGVLMAKGVIKVGGWNKFAPIFMGIGSSSMVMGLITGEFFTNETLLRPFALWVTGLFGTPHAPILHVMPSSDPHSVLIIFGIFGVTIALGVIINSVGLIINVINNFSLHRWGSAIFGKTGLAGVAFFWYVLSFAVRVAAFSHKPDILDAVVIALTLFFCAFGEPFERLANGERPVIENGVGAMLIGGAVELIEVISTYLSSTISFVRVGAFALAHAVLGFIIALMSEKSGIIGGALVIVIGNAVVIVLEGMIVAIQVIRLQYYEFFSKFFTQTGKEFKPMRFFYKE